MKIGEDYAVISNEPTSSAFRIKILDPDSEFMDWIFLINGMRFEEHEEDDYANLEIDYEVVFPEAGSVVLESYTGANDQRILDTLGPCIENILELAIEHASLTIKEENQATDDPR